MVRIVDVPVCRTKEEEIFVQDELIKHGAIPLDKLEVVRLISEVVGTQEKQYGLVISLNTRDISSDSPSQRRLITSRTMMDMMCLYRLK